MRWAATQCAAERAKRDERVQAFDPGFALRARQGRRLYRDIRACWPQINADSRGSETAVGRSQYETPTRVVSTKGRRLALGLHFGNRNVAYSKRKATHLSWYALKYVKAIIKR